jgi:hypothetical protein
MRQGVRNRPVWQALEGIWPCHDRTFHVSTGLGSNSGNADDRFLRLPSNYREYPLGIAAAH